MVQNESNDFHLQSRLLWTNNSAFGVVHPSNCHTCLQYMTHIAAASHSENDPSFKVALKERDYQYNTYYLNGVCEGRRLQREYTQNQAEQLEVCRAERDEALEVASKHFINLCTVRDELEKLKEEYRALQQLFEDVAEFGGNARCYDRSPSFDAQDFDDIFYDPLSEDECKISRLLQPDSPKSQCSSQLPTPPESPVHSLSWGTIELPTTASNYPTFFKSAEPPDANLPSEIAEPFHNHSGSGPSTPIEESQGDSTPSSDLSSVNCAPPTVEPGTFEQVQSLVHSACVGDEQDLAKVKALCTQAHLTPRGERTEFQRFLLSSWKGTSTSTFIPPDNISTRAPGHSSERADVPLVRHPIFVDSSPSWGIGFVMNESWLAWKFKKGWKSAERDNNWGEMVAVELGLRVAISAGYHSGPITIKSDNAGVVRSLKTGISKNFQQNVILQKILQLCHTYNIRLTPSWVSTRSNPADKPSRGVFSSRALLFPNPPALPVHLLEFFEPPIEFQKLPVQ